jgi:predicted transport protein
MSSLDQAYSTQLENIQKKTGKSLEELAVIVQSSGLSKHSEIRSMLMEKLGLGYGDANMLTLYVNKQATQSPAKEKGSTTDQVLDEIYSGPKASLRPVHDKLMGYIDQFGEFEIAPKKGYVALRRKRQFAMLGPATNTRFELGINIKNLESDERLIEQPAGSMCNYKVRLADADQVDETIIGWLRRAYEAAG